MAQITLAKTDLKRQKYVCGIVKEATYVKVLLDLKQTKIRYLLTAILLLNEI